ncbi:putative ribosomal RNA-processing protein 12 [Coleophoma cylindrospora]|uniref:Putative ribosomal RNA-processing protein 12 n=1 Tax=Coleophoma cylindrospora TaxID=1849047 RepID=A0A3D8S821_9HELO|nr:putative ribosomal RNA-processing protein 12 [Coleophoma cylindrospora]
MSTTLVEKLDKIRSPKLQGQQQNGVVLSAVEDTLREQKTEPTPTGYFAALLALLRQAVSSTGVVNKDLATSVVYLLDVVTPYAPAPLLRSKFSQILTNLAPALTLPEADAPLLRPSIGCLESLLVAQDSAAWELSATQIGPRRAIAGLLNLAVDHRPKIRKRAQEAITKVLKNPPPSPSSDHPAADMCAETAMKSLSDLAAQSSQAKKQRKGNSAEHDPALIHALQLVKTVAAASGGWPSKKIEALCEILLNISRSSNEYMTMAAFEVFELIFEGMAEDEMSSAKLPRLLEVISELRPSQNDSQLLPPWIAVLSRGYDVSAQLEPEDTFQKLPELFNLISSFLASSSHNIRVSASECLISFMANCVPDSVLLEPSIYDEKVLEKLAKAAVDLLSVKYQAAWMETFNVIGAMFDNLRWQADPIMNDALRTIGELRSNGSFAGNKEADEIIGKAVRAMGPESVLKILPLNLAKPQKGQPGRAWMLPVLRDYVSNTNLQHFKSEFVPLSEVMFQRVVDNGEAEKTMEIKIFETLVQQIWALLPGYCDLPLDLTESFDQGFAELVSNLLYQQVNLRPDICKALQTLVESNKVIAGLEGEDDLVLQSRVSKEVAQKNLDHLSGFASNMLSILFNVYSQTLPQYRGYILNCINAYLSIAAPKDLMETFQTATTMLESSLAESGAQTQAEKQKQKQQNAADKMPPMSHTLMDLVITISIYLPRESFSTLFNISSLIIIKDDDPQLQKKAYKLIPRLAVSDAGKVALQERSTELQQLLLNSAEKVSAPAKRDRLTAISTLIPFLPNDSLHFIPAVLSEVVISCKEVNERARTAAFDLLILMGEKIVAASGSTIDNSKVSHMPDDAPAVKANLEEYFTMVSAGLAGSTPHMVSASITALTRILYHFRESLSSETLTDLVQTMDLFLTSNNREIVRSVLGFVKVCVISLSTTLMLPRLESLIPNLMVWSHEHTAHFKAKVKHILERMIRRFGVDVVNKYCPEDDKKLISNIRKTKERAKRQKEASKAEGAEGSDDEDGAKGKRKGRFESEFDEALHGSDDDSDGTDVSDNEVLGKSKKGSKKGGKTYIVEDEAEPLDLLDRRALANISSTKPIKQREIKKSKVKMDLDGKLLLGGDSDDGDDQMVLDTPAEKDEGGVDAYVSAIKGRDAVQRGRGGRLKFSNKRSKDDDEEMDVDEEEIKVVKKQIGGDMRGGFRGGRGRGGGGRGGVANGRRGLGEGKRHDQGGHGGGGRVMKSPRGRGRGRR